VEKILVIDDEPQILKTLVRYLGAEGYDVLTAKEDHSSAEACARSVLDKIASGRIL
jgi:DNA-binding response OmpR family regulator